MSGKWMPFLVGLVVGVIFSSTVKGLVGKSA
jgi:hypothetical protein